MHEEFQKLLTLLIQAGEVAKPDVNELVLKTLAFFQAMKREFIEASPSERKELIEQIKSMHAQLSEELTKVLKKVGMSEDQLTNVFEDPKIFTSQQQDFLARAKQEIEETKKSVSRKLSKGKPDNQKKKPSGHKSKWMKS